MDSEMTGETLYVQGKFSHFNRKISDVLKSINLKMCGTQELGPTEMNEVNGGNIIIDLIQLLEYTVKAGVMYSKYSMETGGQYVIHHAY